MDRREHAIGRSDVVVAGLAVLALELEVVGEDLRPLVAATAAFAVIGATIALRRAAPRAGLLLGSAALLAAAGFGVPLHSAVLPIGFVLVMQYAVAVRRQLRPAIAALVGGIVLTGGSLGLAGARHGGFDWTDLPFVALINAAPWAIGRAMGTRVRESHLLERRAEALEQERIVAVAEERGRIARELHDVIAHSVSVMVVQAGAAEAVLSEDASRALAPIRAIQETGRQALVEMSRLVGLLRDDSHELGLAPQPRLDELPALAAQMRAAGLPVELRIEGAPRELPLGIELTAYRVVQEALTNSLKHAGHGEVEVIVRYRADELLVEVVDNGRTAPPTASSGGHGLVGMRERVAVYRGELDAGPRDGGGFGVRARLPFGGAT